jgi:hypothetical protein
MWRSLWLRTAIIDARDIRSQQLRGTPASATRPDFARATRSALAHRQKGDQGMNLIKPAAAVIAAVVLFGAGSVLADDCDPDDLNCLNACNISDLNCSKKGSTCNIKFHNNTGKSSGSGGPDYKQSSWAATIKIEAVKYDGGRAGSNTIELMAGQSHTDNLDKKKNFNKLKIWSTSTSRSGEMHIPCDEIHDVLVHKKDCKIFTVVKGRPGTQKDYLAYNCAVVDGISENYFDSAH